MKKVRLLILFFIIALTGCSIVRIDTESIDNILNVILSKDNDLYNQIGQGYKYYLPGGMSYIDSDDLNDILYSNGIYYYLYIDTINYHYKTKVDYKEKNDVYYSKFISPKENSNIKHYGYLEINKLDDIYYVEFFYNYGKIEVQTTYEELNNVILNSSYILSTIKYNNDIVKLMLEDDYFTNKTGKYDNYNAKDTSESFKLKKEDKMMEE